MFFIVVFFLLLSGLTCSIFNFASSRIAILLFKTVSSESPAYSGLMGGGGGGTKIRMRGPNISDKISLGGPIFS